MHVLVEDDVSVEDIFLPSFLSFFLSAAVDRFTSSVLLIISLLFFLKLLHMDHGNQTYRYAAECTTRLSTWFFVRMHACVESMSDEREREFDLIWHAAVT